MCRISINGPWKIFMNLLPVKLRQKKQKTVAGSEFWKRPLKTTFWTGLVACLWHTITVPNHPFLELSLLSVNFWDSGNHSHTHTKPANTTELKAGELNPQNNEEAYYKELLFFWCYAVYTILNRTFPRNSLALKKPTLIQRWHKQEHLLNYYFLHDSFSKLPLLRGNFAASLKRATWLLVMDETDIQFGKELVPPSLRP